MNSTYREEAYPLKVPGLGYPEILIVVGSILTLIVLTGLFSNISLIVYMWKKQLFHIDCEQVFGNRLLLSLGISSIV